jgi:hypothetical protein
VQGSPVHNPPKGVAKRPVLGGARCLATETSLEGGLAFSGPGMGDVTPTKQPTWEDADLLLRIDELAARDETRRAIDWFRATHLGAEAPNMHPILRDAPEFTYVSRFIELFETMGTLVKFGLLSEEIVHDRWMSRTVWDFLKPTIERERRTIASPTLAENFEWLAERNRAWAQRRASAPRKRTP